MLDLAVILLVAASLTFAVVCGDSPEKRGGQIMLVVLGFSVLRLFVNASQVAGFDLLGLLSDVLAFFGFLWIALFAWRIWPLWTAALQLLAIGAHFGPALDLSIAPLAYAIMRSAPTAIAILTLVGATWLHRSKARSGVSMPPWRTWSGPLSRISPTN
jgi:hypothetical protein